MNHFSIILLPVMKSGFYTKLVTISSVVRLRRNSKSLSKAKFAPKKVMVTIWWSAAGLIHYSFLNPSESITSEKYAQKIDEMYGELHHLQQALQFSAHPINMLSILLRCNGFTGIQKAVVDQTSSRPPNSDHDLFLVQVWLWKVLWSFFSFQPLSWLSYKIHFSLHVTIWLRNGLLLHRIREDDASKWQFFLICGQLMRHLGEGNGTPLQYSCLENPMDGGAW